MKTRGTDEASVPRVLFRIKESPLKCPASVLKGQFVRKRCPQKPALKTCPATYQTSVEK